MTAQETQDWFKQFDDTKETFHWFFTKYYETIVWEDLIKYRTEKDWNEMMKIMNAVWFSLPDSQFNSVVSPPGWSEFLSLIEL